MFGFSEGAFAYSVGAFSIVQKPGGPVADNFSEQDGAIFASVDTGSVDNPALGSEARASATVDLASRSLRVFVRADGPSINPSASATGVADITIQPSTLLPEGEIVPVPFSMTVSGVADLDDPGFCLSTFAEMLSSSIDGLISAEPILGGCGLLGALPVANLSGVARLVVGTPATVRFRLGAALNLLPKTPVGMGGIIDASQTAVVSFEFPDGAVVTSDPPEFLPEPSAGMAPIAGIAGLVAISQVRRNRSQRLAPRTRRSGGDEEGARRMVSTV